MNSKLLVITEEVVNGFIRGFNLIPPLYKYKSITDVAAEILGKSEVLLDLDSVMNISVYAIHNIVKRQDDLCLGITEITNEQAQALTVLRKKLSLKYLEDISLSSLKILVSTPRELLALDGLKCISPEQARLLSQFRGDLSLEGLSQLDQEVARYLVGHVGNLFLGNLKAITTEETRYLVGHQGSIHLDTSLRVQREGAYLLLKHLDLQVNTYSQENYLEDCLAEGTDEAIATARKNLDTAHKTLCLDSLNALNHSGAKVLAEFPGELQLPVIEELDPTVAALLAQHNGPQLALDGMRLLTGPVANALGKHRGGLLLRGIRSFEEGSPSLLALHDGSLTLPLPEGGNEKFGWFKVHDAKIAWRPSGIDHHDLAVMGEIMQSLTVEIEIPEEVHFVSNTVLARLGYACRSLGKRVAIPGLRHISHEQSQLLTASHLEKSDTPRKGSLALDGVLEFSAQVSAELGNSGLNNLTLNGLESISEEGCKYLAMVPGQLCLDGIRILPSGCAATISRHRGRLTLNGLSEVSGEQAEDLARHNGTVELKGIKWLKMNSELLKGFIDGGIILDELEVYQLICKFCEKLDAKPSNASVNLKKASRIDVSIMPELIAQILIDLITRFLHVEKAMRISDTVLRTHKTHHSERYVFDFLAATRMNPPKRAIDDLINHVTANYLKNEICTENDEDDRPCWRDRKIRDHRTLRETDFQKTIDIVSHNITTCFNNIDSYRPDFKPIINACLVSLKNIMCSGLTGESNISSETLASLGCFYGKWINLPEVDKLCVNGAKALSLLDAELTLNGIKELTPEIASILSQHVGYQEIEWDVMDGTGQTIYYGLLCLDGIKHLDVDTATALARHRGNTLSLNGITTVSDAVASALGQHKGYGRCLMIDGIQTLSPCAAQALSGCLNKDTWDLVGRDQVETRCEEAILAFHARNADQIERSAGEEQEFEIELGVKILMCWIPPGEFLMGSPINEPGRRYGESKHWVGISRGFWLGKYQVTQAQWQAVMGSNPSHFKGSDLPVECVRWDDITRPGDFLERINCHAGAGCIFTLPTEAQWEYACRAGTVSALNSGKDLTTNNRLCPNLDEVAWYQENSGGTTHPCGQKKANSWGLHDMHGNVCEWCADCAVDYSSELQIDPRGPDSGLFRVFRGGGWNSESTSCRTAYRINYDTRCGADIGFRIARSSVPQQK